MRSLTKTTVLAGLAGLGLAATPSHAAPILPIVYAYSFAPNVPSPDPVESLTISDPYLVTLKNIVISESLLSDPTVFAQTTMDFQGNLLSLAPGQSLASDVNFALPYGDQPQNTLFDPQSGPLPFLLTVSASDSAGQQYGFSRIQTYNPDGSPAVPESGTMALLAAGLGLLGVASLRRKRAM